MMDAQTTAQNDEFERLLDSDAEREKVISACAQAAFAVVWIGNEHDAGRIPLGPELEEHFEQSAKRAIALAPHPPEVTMAWARVIVDRFRQLVDQWELHPEEQRVVQNLSAETLGYALGYLFTNEDDAFAALGLSFPRSIISEIGSRNRYPVNEAHGHSDSGQ